jgi:hypothetical protein
VLSVLVLRRAIQIRLIAVASPQPFVDTQWGIFERIQFTAAADKQRLRNGKT